MKSQCPYCSGTNELQTAVTQLVTCHACDGQYVAEVKVSFHVFPRRIEGEVARIGRRNVSEFA